MQRRQSHKKSPMKNHLAMPAPEAAASRALSIAAARRGAVLARGAALVAVLLLIAPASDRGTSMHSGIPVDLPPLMLWAWDRNDNLRFIDTADTGVALTVVAPADPAAAAAVLDGVAPGGTQAVECPEALCTFGDVPRAGVARRFSPSPGPVPHPLRRASSIGRGGATGGRVRSAGAVFERVRDAAVRRNRTGR